jgi:hypothetical protein
MNNPSAEVTTAPGPAQNPPGVTVTATLSLSSLIAQIATEADIQPSELAALRRVDRLVVGETRWDVGQAPPGNDKLLVAAIFQGERPDDPEASVPGDLRLYLTPNDPADPGQAFWQCLTLSRTNPSLVRETMVRQAWMDAIGEELRALAILQGIIEEADDDSPGEPS